MDVRSKIRKVNALQRLMFKNIFSIYELKFDLLNFPVVEIIAKLTFKKSAGIVYKICP